LSRPRETLFAEDEVSTDSLSSGPMDGTDIAVGESGSVDGLAGPPTDRPQRADAQRNRRRLLEAAEETFRERGLEVSVGEIAHRAGIGRATLFRNFPTKQDLVAAIVGMRMREASAEGRALLESGQDDEMVFSFVEDIVGRQQIDRALFEAVGPSKLLNHPELREAHAEVLEVLNQLLERGKRAGVVRPEVDAMDVLILVKGVCTAAASLPGENAAAFQRHLDLALSGITTDGHSRRLSNPGSTGEALWIPPEPDRLS
jgi:AcrR family transcriptional regulator